MFDNLRKLIKTRASSEAAELLNKLDDSVLSEIVGELLEKSNSGRKGNPFLTLFSKKGSRKDAHMLRDAIGHHVSHYKAARKKEDELTAAGDSEGAKKFADAANQHILAVKNKMYLAKKKHGNGAISLDAVNPKYWEQNHIGTDNKKRNSKGWGIPISAKNAKTLRFLDQAPHESHKDENSKGHKHTYGAGHEGGYPFGQISISASDGAGGFHPKKYISIDDKLESPGEYVPHEFDSHPLLSTFGGKKPLFERKSQSFGDIGSDDYNRNIQEVGQAVKDWVSGASGHWDSYMKRHREMEQADPEGYRNRGSEPFGGMPVANIKVSGEEDSAPTKTIIKKPSSLTMKKPTKNAESSPIVKIDRDNEKVSGDIKIRGKDER